MAERKKITKKVISNPSKKEAETKETETIDSSEKAKIKKSCFFCQSKTTPTYTDLAVLKRYVSDRSKIIPKLKSNLCSKHQRGITRQIKYARELALLPFVPKV